MAVLFKSPYGTRHRTAPRMHLETIRHVRHRIDRYGMAREIVANQTESGNLDLAGPPYRHPECEVEHRMIGRAMECAAWMIWRLAEDPEFLKARVTMREYLEGKGWL